MFDVQPSPNPVTQSVIDLTVIWLEHQPLPPLPTPLYFAIRYGPIIRYLVDDGHQTNDIMAGYETIVRTGQTPPVTPDPTRHIDIPGMQRNSLMKMQVCALYDSTSEPTIQWDKVPSSRIDLAALEPFLEVDAISASSPPNTPNAMIPPDSSMFQISPIQQQPDTIPDNGQDVPFVITVGVDSGANSTIYWISVIAGVMIVISTAVLMFMCLRRSCKVGRRGKHMKDHKEEKVVYYVNSQPLPPPTFNDVVKVAPA